MAYNRTMRLGQQVMVRTGTVKAPRSRMLLPSFTSRGVSTFARTRPGWSKAVPLTHTNYYNAGVLVAYGKTNEAAAQLGDLFNDVMGAIVPGWDQRPDALKQIVIRPDPTKILQAAQRIDPNAGAQIITAANQAGLNVYANTPAGLVPITPTTAQSLYANYPLVTRAQATLAGIPTWVWLAGGGGLLLLIVMARR